MAYTVKKSNGDEIIVQNGTLNTETSLYLVGKNFAGYGEYIAEDLVWLLEHHASYSAPVNPTLGQLWFDMNIMDFRVWNNDSENSGEWVDTSLRTLPDISAALDNLTASLGGTIDTLGDDLSSLKSHFASSTQPTNPVSGQLWYKTTDEQFYYWDGTTWVSLADSHKHTYLYSGSTIKATAVSTGLNVSGAIVASGDVTAFSDERLKHNIQTIENALDKVKDLRGVSFNKDDKDSIGVIAQEVERVLPQVVHTADDEMGTKSVAYGNMVGVLIEAVKELSEKVDVLSATVETQKAEIAMLKGDK